MKNTGLRYSAYLLSALLLSADVTPCAAAVLSVQKERKVEKIKATQWKGKKVAFLGDSITDKIHVGTKKNYWQFLEEMLGLEAHVYGINGHQWDGILAQAKLLKEEMGDEVDAIFIFAGTNDYNAGLPLGNWYNYQQVNVEVSGPQQEKRMQRVLQTGSDNFRGRINKVMGFLKENFPKQQIILLTPIHRASANFGPNNIQPDESYPNQIGEYVDAYVVAVNEASNVWAVPVIDLNSICGLYPLSNAQTGYFHKEKTDRLHPNAEGHYRMAKSIAYQLQLYPSDFK